MLTGAREAVRRHHFRLRHACVLIVTLPFLSPFELTEMIFHLYFGEIPHAVLRGGLEMTFLLSLSNVSAPSRCLINSDRSL